MQKWLLHHIRPLAYLYPWEKPSGSQRRQRLSWIDPWGFQNHGVFNKLFTKKTVEVSKTSTVIGQADLWGFPNSVRAGAFTKKTFGVPKTPKVIVNRPLRFPKPRGSFLIYKRKNRRGLEDLNGYRASRPLGFSQLRPSRSVHEKNLRGLKDPKGYHI